MPLPAIILASRSPQRARLLREAGYAFIQMEPPFADPPQPQQVVGDADARALAIDLACRKALSLRETGVLTQDSDAAPSGTVIIAADTICVGIGGQLRASRRIEHPREMIHAFLGHEHEVVTGVALVGVNDAHAEGFADAAWVNMDHIADRELEEYVNSDQWRGKAGGYNLFDRQKAGWPITVRGDATTVVGLPMVELRRRLVRRSIVPAHPVHLRPA